MSETILKYKCPSCTGPMHFDIAKQMVVCDYCGAEFPESHFNTDKTEQAQTINQEIEGNTGETIVLDNQSGFICTSCGAEVVSDGNTAATECMYCGTPIVLTENISGMVKPDVVLPFKIDKGKAEQMLRSFYKKKILLPKAFKDENRIRKIVGMYVPFWLFTSQGRGDIDFDAENVSSHTEGDYKVTVTRHYKAERSGSLDFEKIPVDASRKMEDNYMDGLEPYDYKDLKEFSSTYMAGFFADKFDVEVDECSIRARNRVVNSTREKLKNTVTGYSSVSIASEQIEMIDKDVKYALLPVWMLNTKFEDKMYHFAINGQTGKVSGDLPIDKKKKNFLFWLITIISYILSAVVSYCLFLK